MKVTLILAVIVGIVFGLILNQAATDNAKRQVYAVCNSARLEIDGGSEQRCGDIQDRLGVEFLCTDTSAGINCWTEAK